MSILGSLVARKRVTHTMLRAFRFVLEERIERDLQSRVCSLSGR
jgi:hypothetical protein